MINKFNELRTHHKLLYSVVIIIALIALWRGIWGLMDLLLFKENLLLSYAVSVLLGFVILTLAHYKLV